MITVDFDTFTIEPGMSVLDVGCGQGRHAFEAYRRGGLVTAFDLNETDLADVKAMFAAMQLEGEAPEGATADICHGDVREMPFETGAFDRVIASEILEHVPHDEQAIEEIARVTRPGGLIAVTVPRWWPEQICWKLSDAYHQVEGGHVRIYTESELTGRLESAGLEVIGRHHAHALHSPYWWLKCAVGPDRDVAATRAYHRMLVWDITKAPFVTRFTETALNPLLGKSLVIYLRKP